jgi:hypothetical protein
MIEHDLLENGSDISLLASPVQGRFNHVYQNKGKPYHYCDDLENI